jgi:hypothetical protein
VDDFLFLIKGSFAVFISGILKKVLITAIFIHITVTSVFATSYYIDFKIGNDMNDGLSTNKPFQHCPGDINASQIASRTFLMPGDIVIFKGGVVYEGYIIVDRSGTDSNPIMYISGHTILNGWGETSAIIDAQNADLSSRYNGAISISNASYITVKGLSIQNVPKRGSYSYFGGIGFNGDHGGNITIENCTISGNSGNGIMLQGCWFDKADPPSNFLIIDCHIGFNGEHGIQMRAGLSQVSIVNSTIHHNGTSQPGNGIFAGAGGTGFLRNLTIRGCEIYDNPTKGPMNISGHNMLIENNFIYSTVQLAIGVTIGTEFYVPSMSTRNVTIRNNIIDLDTKYEGAIRVNIPFLTSYSLGYEISDIKIHNNTIIQRGNYYAVFFNKIKGSAANVIANVELINNIIKNAIGTKVCIFTGSGAEIPNFKCKSNYYYSGNNSFAFVWAGKNVNYANWKSTHPEDLKQNVFDDPFPNIQIPSIDTIYSPSTSSPYFGAGITLPARYDYFNQPRTDKWDIGAIEYSQNVIYCIPRKTGYIVSK